jgi:hypothetical protein
MTSIHLRLELAAWTVSVGGSEAKSKDRGVTEPICVMPPSHQLTPFFRLPKKPPYSKKPGNTAGGLVDLNGRSPSSVDPSVSVTVRQENSPTLLPPTVLGIDAGCRQCVGRVLPVSVQNIFHG